MKQILIVDDDHLVCKVLEEIVTMSGYKALVAHSAYAASKVISQEHVDLILLDLVMPGIRGTDFLRGIRRRGDKTPVLVISGSVQKDTARELLSSEISGIIIKPFHADRIKEDIRRVLGADDGPELSA